MKSYCVSSARPLSEMTSRTPARKRSSMASASCSGVPATLQCPVSWAAIHAQGDPAGPRAGLGGSSQNRHLHRYVPFARFRRTLLLVGSSLFKVFPIDLPAMSGLSAARRRVCYPAKWQTEFLALGGGGQG
jgi:hypothetical protein